MPLDSNLPTFTYTQPPRSSPLTTTISHSHSSLPPEPRYTLTRASPSANTYTLTLVDALFPSITYATLSTHLTLASNSPPGEPKPLLPNDLAINLYNPDSTVMLELKSSVLRGNYYEFTLPKRSFVTPSNAGIDAYYRPPETGDEERLTFRWRKEGGALSRKQLRCSLVSPGNLPNSKKKQGAGEPDVTVAIFEGLGDKKGAGELVMMEGGLKRVECEDIKGLEMVLVMGARIINDVYFCNTQRIFEMDLAALQREGPQRRRLMMSPPTPTVRAASPPTQQQQLMNGSGRSFADRYADKDLGPPVAYHRPAQPQQQLHQRQQSYPTTTSRVSERDRIAAEQASIRAMLAAEQAQEERAKQVAVEAETQRLRQLYMPAVSASSRYSQQQQQRQPERRASHPQQQYPARPQQPQRLQSIPQGRPAPPMVIDGMMPSSGGLVVPQQPRMEKRRSFLGLFGMGDEGRGGNRLGKKKSSMW